MARYPLIGYLAWAVLFGAVFAWEGLALAGVTGVPSFSDVVRVIMRYPVGRWALFALWLWAGWQLVYPQMALLAPGLKCRTCRAGAAADRALPDLDAAGCSSRTRLGTTLAAGRGPELDYLSAPAG